MASELLVSTAVTGVLLLVVVGWTLAGRDWRRARVGTASPVGSSAASDVAGAVAGQSAPSRRVWYAVVLLGAAVVAAAGLIAASGASDAALAVAGVALLVVGYSVVGVYVTARNLGHSTARATAEGLGTLGALLVLAVVVRLLLSGKV
ncbi:MAG: hypothetical protein ABEJ04_06500 [Halobacteriaceae archaeon]